MRPLLWIILLWIGYAAPSCIVTNEDADDTIPRRIICSNMEHEDIQRSLNDLMKMYPEVVITINNSSLSEISFQLVDERNIYKISEFIVNGCSINVTENFFTPAFRALSKVSITGSGLKSFSPSILKYAKMSSLDLSRNEIFQLISSTIKLDTVEELDLSHNYISIIPVKFFTSFKNLKRLHWSHNHYNWQSLGALAPLHNLQFFNLSNNGFNDIRRVDIYSLRDLRILDISGNSLRGQYPSYYRQIFDQFPYLTYVGLHSNNWVCYYLVDILQYLDSSNVSYLPYSQILDYSGQNIMGIKCS